MEEIRPSELKETILDARDWNDRLGPLKVVLGEVVFAFDSAREVTPILHLFARAQNMMEGLGGLVKCPACSRVLLRLEDRADSYIATAKMKCPCGHLSDHNWEVTKV